MSYKRIHYTYRIISKGPAELASEIDIVGNAFQDAGWIECKIIPDDGFPAYIIFEWTRDDKPIRPIIPSF